MVGSKGSGFFAASNYKQQKHTVNDVDAVVTVSQGIEELFAMTNKFPNLSFTGSEGSIQDEVLGALGENVSNNLLELASAAPEYQSAMTLGSSSSPGDDGEGD